DGRAGERVQRFSPALGFQEGQRATPPALRFDLEPQQQRASLVTRYLSVHETIEQAVVHWTNRLVVFKWQIHSSTSLASAFIMAARSRLRARCSRASTALSLTPRRSANSR